jgi:hypothetical protein
MSCLKGTIWGIRLKYNIWTTIGDVDDIMRFSNPPPVPLEN